VGLEGARLAGELLVERVGEEVRQLPGLLERHDVDQPQLLLAAGDGEHPHLPRSSRASTESCTFTRASAPTSAQREKVMVDAVKPSRASAR
jgi:hypothetical protein